MSVKTWPLFVRLAGEMAGVQMQEEYKFHPSRRWRFDFASPELRIAVEVDGGGWVNGRHHRMSGWLKDQEKLNSAAMLGWRVLHYAPDQMPKALADLIYMTNDL